MIDYKEAKKKVSIISILRDWGYKFDKSKGKISPNFVLRDEHGKEIDRVIITNPKKSEEQGYWRRDGGKGDLITFIKENLNQFGVVGRNETDTVTKVLAKLMNIEEEKEQRKKEKATPMERFGEVEELVGATLFLLSEEAAGFITGVVLPIDGGFSAYSGV